ncbi:MAG TPA: urea carboxylase [Bryobacteraceae bacterium]|jgi:urea carboxylase
MMFNKVLIANRGVIACRVIRTLRRMGVRSVAVYSEADRGSLHVEQADEAVLIGAPPPASSYLSVESILDAARKTGAQAIHPGYGFLSENAGFAEACETLGIAFIGPTPEQMIAFGLKHTSREIADWTGTPLLPGTGLLADAAEALDAAGRIGYPVMLKSTAGGGGIGMRLCRTADELSESFEAVARLGLTNFGDAGVFLEKAVTRARHIEVQIFGDGRGLVVALGERDCSAQRRNQKVLEETPAPGLPDEVRQRLLNAAVRLGESVKYRSAGTVEFIYDDETASFYFLEVNTRLQVEHGVTEEVTGIDLVEWMVRTAAGETAFLKTFPNHPQGASMQARIYAEDPGKAFQPCAGRLSEVIWPASARVETWVESGSEVTPYYDPMLAKIIVRGEDRAAALGNLRAALDACSVAGIETNVRYLRRVVRDPAFVAGGITTAFLGNFEYVRDAMDVVAPGTQSTVQDYPGRLGYWHVGVPPSGPMDHLAIRMANRLAGNPEGAPGLEMVVTGPALRFARERVAAITGADFAARLDGVPVPRWKPFRIPAGALLEFGSAQGAGSRAYLAVAGGFDVPEYLGSRSTFILGKFGGHAGRTLRAGDVLHFGTAGEGSESADGLPEPLIPSYTRRWEIGVLYGPHGAPDFFTDGDIEMFFSTDWEVHYNSDRTGVRLIGPKPVWARKDGGEAGLHPSNIHDNAYAVGTVDFTGDMPVILGPDGPSLGGFVCPATIVQAELWKMGQLKPGDAVRFIALSQAQAERMEGELDRAIQSLSGRLPSLPASERSDPVLETTALRRIRADGDKYLLVEYGPNVLDLNLRFRIHSLENQLRGLGVRGIIDITPGVRSLHIHYDTRVLSRQGLLDALDVCEGRIPDANEISVPSRIVHLPLSWDDPQTRLAIQKYMQSVRPDAPWCPSNIEFIRRINGLNSIDDVHRIVFDASYLVLGLGDVYLGAPVATPIDPRHRLVTTKYNPARTWTPENAVGIGGAYLCVYGMEGPGGYQFVGRTVQMWNSWKSTAAFERGTPWLLRFFDQIRFYPVSAEELLDARNTFPSGGYPLRIENTSFQLAQYRAFLESTQAEASNFKRTQQAAFDAERERWAAAGQWNDAPALDTGPAGLNSEDSIPEGCQAVPSPLTANVWNVAVTPGEPVNAGQKLVVLEAMKMEIMVTAPVAGIVEKLSCTVGTLVSAGQNLVTLRAEVL